MIESERLIAAVREQGFTFFTGVPCSYLTPFLARIAGGAGVTYLPAANEGDAVAIAAGAVLGGRPALVFMQNSGLGNAVNPLASLTWTFRIPMLLMVTLRGQPPEGDEPQHRLMGGITERMLEQLEIPCERLPEEARELAAVLARARRHLESEGRPYALLIRGGALASESKLHATAPRLPARAARVEHLVRGHPIEDRPTRARVLARIVEATPTESTALISTTGYTSRELCALFDRANQLYMVGSMGCASALGLGLACVRPDLRVVVVDGDGALLMRLGNLAAVGAHGGANLHHIVLDNQMHESTGGQPTLSAGVSLAEVARACGYARALEGDDLGAIDALLGGAACAGPSFAHVRIRAGTLHPLPRPELSPEQARARFEAHVRKRGEHVRTTHAAHREGARP
jgi:phosphonopyruvate decarboxylase